MALRIVARMIARGIKHALDHKVSSALILLLVIALIFVSTARTSQPSGALASQTASVAPISTENYFEGQSTFDSNLIWQSLSDELISRAEMNGATKDELQAQLDQAKELGRVVDTVSYIGGYNMEDGQSMQFYVAAVRSSTDTPPDYIFYVFTLGLDGKIVSIE